jgi:hypothetical protein
MPSIGSVALGEDIVDPRIDVLNQSWRQIGVMVEMDKGDGALSTVLLSELSGDITMRGSINGFGVRELTFQRFGDSQSPFKSDLLRGMRQVRLTGFRGIPGVMASQLMFDGYIRDSQFNGLSLPSVATIHCQDKSLAYVDAPLFYNLEPASLRGRVNVVLDALAAAGIPAGVFETPAGTGIIYKAVSEPGTRRVLDFLTEFLLPIGVTGYWRNGVYNFRRFDTSGDPVRTLQLGDFRTLSIVPPPTNAANQVQVTTSMFAYLGPPGVRVVTETVTTPGSYTPVAATSKQDHTTGVVSAIAPAVVPDTKILQTVTTTTYDGGTVTDRVTLTYGYYAPKACPNRQTAAGVTTYNGTFDVYQFPDGTWRSQSTETWQLIKDEHLARTFDIGTGVLTQEDTDISQFAAIQIPYRTLNLPTDVTELFIDVLMSTAGTDGRAWMGGVEQFDRERDSRVFTVTGGVLATSTVFIEAFTAPEYTVIAPPAPGYIGPTVYVFGPTTAKTYGQVASAGGVLATIAQTVTTYTAINSVSHSETTVYSAFAGGPYQPATFQTNLSSLPGTPVTVAGPVPFLEIKSSNQQQPQPATFTVDDRLRQSLALGNTIPDYRQNGYCETDTELQTVGVEAMRAIAAPVVTIEMDIDWTIVEGSVIAIIHPRFGYGAVKLLVTDINWTFSPSSGRNSQTLTCRWYPPELVSLAA